MYRIAWKKRAFNQMDRLVARHPPRKQAFAAALKDMAGELSHDPEQVGESREGNERFACFGPLAIYFQVFPADRLVRVVSVHLTRPFR